MGTFHDYILRINMRNSIPLKENSEARSAIEECTINNVKRRDLIPVVSLCCICSNRKARETISEHEAMCNPLVLTLLWELGQIKENERLGIRTK